MAYKKERPRKAAAPKGHLKRQYPFYLMMIPGVVFVLIFSYLPMFGIVMAFQNLSLIHI